MTNISPTTVASKEGSPLRPAACADDDATDAERCGKDPNANNNGYLQPGRPYQTAALLPEVRTISVSAAAADDLSSCKSGGGSRFRVRDVSPMEAARHKTAGSTCYRILIPETGSEKLVLFVCLAVFVTLLVSLVYFFVKIECVFGTEDQKCKS